MAEELEAPNNSFFVFINGEIESATFPFCQDIYCKYSFVSGPDWMMASGNDEGISQVARKGFDDEQRFVWNLPLSIIYKSTNPSGWPQLVVSVYGMDVFGNDVVRGYGAAHVPIAPGHRELSMPMFVPESSTTVQKFTSWLTGRRPEFTDPRILAQGDNREVIRVRSDGYVNMTFDTTIRGLLPIGYIY